MPYHVLVTSKKITVLFDAQAATHSQRTGIGFYVSNLLSQLSKNHPELNLVGHHFGSGDNRNLSPAIRVVASRLVPAKLQYQLRRMKLAIPFEILGKTKPDVILYPDFIGYPSAYKRPIIPIIHDLTYLEHPGLVSPRNRADLQKFVPRFLKKAAVILAISETTKKLLIKSYGVQSSRILVTHPGAPDLPDVEHKPKVLLPKKYILFVGTLEPRKNFLGLVKAYESLPEKIKEEYGLVLAGRKGWSNQEDLDYVENLAKGGNKVVLTGYVSDAEKAYLYSHASLFVLPSHYEGFGMPILEAMSKKIPVAISNIPIFHEVAGEAAVFFDHHDPSDISVKIEACLKDESLRQRLVLSSEKNIKRFSWEKSAAVLYQAIESVVS